MAESHDKESVPARRPITRSQLKSALVFPPSSARKTKAKTVKFVEPESSTGLHNSSVATDEGVDVSFSSCTGSISVPASITRSQHSLNSAWAFWFSSGNKRANWKQNQIVLASLTSVEEFWNTYNKV